MFFVLSKILSFILAPLTWIFIGLIYLLKKTWNSPLKKAVLIFTVTFYVLCNSFLTDEVIRVWEYEDDDIYLKDTKYDLAIVLGGMGRVDIRQQRFDFVEAADRLMQALELYKKGRVKKLMITGGSGSVLHPEQKEAMFVRKYMLSIGIPDSCIIVETESKNTRENAVMSKQVLDSLHFKGSILLVTSSFHMRRAIGCFHQAGFENFTPYITNKITGERKYEFDHCLIPNTDALKNITKIIHEIVGYCIYKIKGYA